MRLYLNKDVVFRKSGGLICIYNNETGLFFYGNDVDVRFLRSFKDGIEPERIKRESDLSQLIPNLLNDRFLMLEMDLKKEAYLNLFPSKTHFTVYYEHINEGVIDVAVNRIGKNGEADFDVLTLKDLHASLWNLCDGTGTLGDLLSKLWKGQKESSFEAVLGELKGWTALDTQIIRFEHLRIYAPSQT